LNGSSDAINFSQGRVWTIDKYGKYIWLTQTIGPTNHWAWSNNDGANWTQGQEGYGYLLRGSVAYDPQNDKLHVIWAGLNSQDGIIYRRYGITRDLNNNITAISREDAPNINLQLDTSLSNDLNLPVALWVNDGSANGSLVAIWSKNGSNFSEIRGSMRKLSLTAADGAAGNWTALDNSASTFAVDPPAVAANKIYATTANANAGFSAIIRGGTGARKDDLYVFVSQAGTSSVLAYRAVWNSISKDWRGGFQSPVTVGSMDNSSGYPYKQQLITKPVLDSVNDRLYIGWARWKSALDGDTVSIAYLNSADSPSATYDVYSALGTHSYAPTLDIAYDQLLGRIYVSFIESTTNGGNGHIDYEYFNGVSLSYPIRFYTSPGGLGGQDGSADIPIMYENRVNNKLLFAFRVNGALPPTVQDPHTIYWGYAALSLPEPTPTVTPQPTHTPTSTPTPTPALINSISSSSNSDSSSGRSYFCQDPQPLSLPNLFQINTSDTQAKLFFTPISNTNQFFISFSENPDAQKYGELVTLGRVGVQSRIVFLLKPDTTYYFKVRGQNGCMPGEWSNVLKIKTDGRIYYKNHPNKIFSFIKILSSKITKPVSPIVAIPSPLPTFIPTPTPVMIKIIPPAVHKTCFLLWCW
ncbi:MAG TPA: fibronectin type III domain-containing protein, partial [Patescibacteria group bacterium]